MCLLAAGFLAVALAVDPHTSVVQPVDEAWRGVVDATRGRDATVVARVLAVIGAWPWAYLAVLVAVAVLVILRHAAAAVYLATTFALTAVLAIPLLKVAVDRPRPPGQLIEVGGMSYPSGHTGITAVVMMSLLLLTPRRGRWASAVVAGAATALMAWSRTYLSVHWLSDTVGGALIGIGIALAGYVAVAPHLAPPARPPVSRRE
jgi:undecaprenyl-diphosphatase